MLVKEGGKKNGEYINNKMKNIYLRNSILFSPKKL